MSRHARELLDTAALLGLVLVCHAALTWATARYLRALRERGQL